MVKYNPSIFTSSSEHTKPSIVKTPPKLSLSIKKILALGGLTAISSGTWANTLVNPNEMLLNPDFPINICTSDVDQDGDQDLFSTSKEAVNLFKNTGTPESPEFAPPVFFSNDTGNFNLVRLGLSDCYIYPRSISTRYSKLVDIDADGDLDLFASSDGVGGKFPTYLDYFRNDGTSEHPVYNKEISENPHRDDHPDIFGLPGSQTVYESFTFHDVDNDGDEDFFLQSLSGHIFYENIGTPINPSFTVRSESPFPNIGGEKVLHFVDLNNDDQLDVLSHSGEFGSFEKVDLFESSPTGYLPEKNIVNLRANRDIGNIVTLDIDQDGDTDLLTESGDHILLYSNLDSNILPKFDRPSFYSMISYNGSSLTGANHSFLSDLDKDGDLDVIYDQHNIDKNLVYAINTGSNANPIYENSVTSLELDQCDASISGQIYARGLDRIVLVDIDQDNDYDLFTQFYLKEFDDSLPQPSRRGDSVIYFCENQGTSSSPIFASGVINPFGLAPHIDASHKLVFRDLDGDSDLDAIIGSAYFENIGNANNPLFNYSSQILYPAFHSQLSAVGENENNNDWENSIIIGNRLSKRTKFLYKGIEPITDILVTTLNIGNFILVTVRPSQVQIHRCLVHPLSVKSECLKTIVVPTSASEVSLSAGDFNSNQNDDIVLAMRDSEGHLKVNIYNIDLELIGTGAGGDVQSISVSSGQLDNDPDDEGVVSYRRADGKAVAISFNLDGSIIAKVIAGQAIDTSVAAGYFDEKDSFVLGYLNPDNQIKTATYQGNGTLISQGEGEKSSHLSIIAADILDNYAGDEYISTFIQQDGRAGLLGFAGDNSLLGKVVGGVIQQPQVKSGTFPGINDRGLAAAVIQSDQKPAIIFLDNQGRHLATGVGTTKATTATLTLIDTDSDGIDEGILFYVSESGFAYWEIFSADGVKK